MHMHTLQTGRCNVIGEKKEISKGCSGNKECQVIHLLCFYMVLVTLSIYSRTEDKGHQGRCSVSQDVRVCTAVDGGRPVQPS